MKKICANIPGYNYGSTHVPSSQLTNIDFALLKQSARFTEQDERYLRVAGEVLQDQTLQIVQLWRSGIIAAIPNLARHSRDLNGEPLPDYLAQTNLRFQQWILDTCLRPYDDDWLNYQMEIARRHTSFSKNMTDGVNSTDHVPFRDLISFVPVMNETIRPFLAAKGHPAGDVEGMHLAWQKSLQIQMAIWAKYFLDRAASAVNEWWTGCVGSATTVAS